MICYIVRADKIINAWIDDIYKLVYQGFLLRSLCDLGTYVQEKMV